MNDEGAYQAAITTRSPAFLFRRVSWGAIFAGFFVTMVVQLIFTVLGVAIGATVFTPSQQANPSQNLATGSALWLLVTGLISLFIGASVAGRLSGGPRRADGMLHGIVSWSVSMVAMLFLVASSAGAVFGGLGTLLNGTLEHSMAQGQSSIANIEGAVGRGPAKGAELSPTGRNEAPAAPSGSIASGDVAAGAWWGFASLVLGIAVAAWGGWTGASSIPEQLLTEVPPEI